MGFFNGLTGGVRWLNPWRFDHPLEVRLACRGNALKTVASRALSGYLCVNVVMMDEAFAAEFEGFCRANPKPCPLLAVMPAGRTDCPEFARGLDIRTDLGSYDVIREGVVVEQRRDVVSLYSGDMVTFLIGSSVSFDGLLVEKGIRTRVRPVYSADRPGLRTGGKVSEQNGGNDAELSPRSLRRRMGIHKSFSGVPWGASWQE